MENRPFCDISFHQYLDEEKLMGSCCTSCNSLSTPPRSLCSCCHTTEMAWVQMQGRGKLLAFSSINIGVKFMSAKGFDRNNPYCVGVVELCEGTKVNARIIGVDAKGPETIKVGMPVKVVFLHEIEAGLEKTYLAFTPA